MSHILHYVTMAGDSWHASKLCNKILLMTGDWHQIYNLLPLDIDGCPLGCLIILNEVKVYTKINLINLDSVSWEMWFVAFEQGQA